MLRLLCFCFLLLFNCSSCSKDYIIPSISRERTTRNIQNDGISVTVIIDQPNLKNVDVLMVFHGTVSSDQDILTAANTTLDKFKGILDRNDMMLISVAYPQENVLLGDSILQAEAALLWLKNTANQELGITIGKIFLAGHSQGGYMVTRLNTLHQTNGVIANAPGPLNLVYRCQLEENGQVQQSAVCTRLKNVYGLTSENSDAYFERSLLNFTNGFKSDILFVQGLNDSPIQMYSWPIFKQEVFNCTDCQSRQFVEILGGEHGSLFDSVQGKSAFNSFIGSH
ncbi:hypothetical protein [Flavobacterium macrobrachii]|uniref:hypothetical protein n=1 Tax=Flavobacterium macrobrachii TaxID=591204 RepID=UPI0016573E21|nr:hypothetical protein [Flavobacterium macrobrachii]